MRLRAFDLGEPVPQLREPHALVVLKPWIDVGNVGTLVLSHLESSLNAQALGQIARPGNFFDFTHYRPTLYLKEGRREVHVPNTSITYAKLKEDHDFLFVHLLEPHMLAETYIDSLFHLLKSFGIGSINHRCILGI